jgi:hypothetical protein
LQDVLSDYGKGRRTALSALLANPQAEEAQSISKGPAGTVLTDALKNPVFFAATGEFRGTVSGVREEQSHDEGQ